MGQEFSVLGLDFAYFQRVSIVGRVSGGDRSRDGEGSFRNRGCQSALFITKSLASLQN
jgi:hypothetical protein